MILDNPLIIDNSIIIGNPFIIDNNYKCLRWLCILIIYCNIAQHAI